MRIVVAMALIVTACAPTPRSEAQPTSSPTPVAMTEPPLPSDPVSPAASAPPQYESPLPSVASRHPTLSTQAPPRTPVPVAPGSGDSQKGVASYYDDGPGLYAAVPSFHFGDRRYRLTVWYGHKHVTVTVRDHCACYVGTSRARIIDLSPAAFAKLAPLWKGLIRVTIP